MKEARTRHHGSCGRRRRAERHSAPGLPPDSDTIQSPPLTLPTPASLRSASLRFASLCSISCRQPAPLSAGCPNPPSLCPPSPLSTESCLAPLRPAPTPARRATLPRLVQHTQIRTTFPTYSTDSGSASLPLRLVAPISPGRPKPSYRHNTHRAGQRPDPRFPRTPAGRPTLPCLPHIQVRQPLLPTPPTLASLRFHTSCSRHSPQAAHAHPTRTTKPSLYRLLLRFPPTPTAPAIRPRLPRHT
jgi:hypothetical protein